MGLVAATPYLFKAFLGPLGGISADMLLRRKIMTIRGVRTFFYAVGMLVVKYFSRFSSLCKNIINIFYSRQIP